MTKILVIDDEEVVLDSCTQVLAGGDCQVLTAGNGADGLGRLEEAVVAYKEAIRLKPDFANAHANLAEVLSKAGRSEEAAAQAREAARLRAAGEARK